MSVLAIGMMTELVIIDVLEFVILLVSLILSMVQTVSQLWMMLQICL